MYSQKCVLGEAVNMNRYSLIPSLSLRLSGFTDSCEAACKLWVYWLGFEHFHVNVEELLESMKSQHQNHEW